MHRSEGTKYVVRELILPYLKDSYDDLMQAVSGADLLVAHPLTAVCSQIEDNKGLAKVGQQ
jgi:hypothetical protein